MSRDDHIPREPVVRLIDDWIGRQYDGHREAALEALGAAMGRNVRSVRCLLNDWYPARGGGRAPRTHYTFSQADKLLTAAGLQHEWYGALADYYVSAPEPTWARTLKFAPVTKRKVSEEQILLLHRAHAELGIPVRHLASANWQGLGYASPATCTKAIWRMFRIRGLPVTPSGEARRKRRVGGVCAHGHELTPGNARISRSQVLCRVCVRTARRGQAKRRRAGVLRPAV